MVQDRLLHPACTLTKTLHRSTHRRHPSILSRCANPVQRRAAAEVLSQYNHRVRKLVLDLPVSHLREIELEFSATFPILVDVSISARRDRRVITWSRIHPEWIPDEIPPWPIRYLRLSFVGVRWTQVHFQNLVEFFLHDQSSGRFDPPIGIFLDILESSPQLAVLSVANAGPRLPLGTTTLPPANRVVPLHNLEHLYLEQEDPCDVGWILVHLDIPISTKVKIHVGLDVRSVPVELVFDQALPNHPGFPHLTDPHRCTYAVDCRSACVITAPNFALRISWNYLMFKHFDEFMMPFLRRATTVEDLTIIHDHPLMRSTSTLRWDQVFGALHSLQKLRVEQSGGGVDPSILAMFQSSRGSALRDLQLSYLVFDEEPWGEEDSGNGKQLVENLVDYCVERDRRGNRLQCLVVEASCNAPPDLASLLVPYVDHVEVREEASIGEHPWDLEFKSREMFHLLRSS